MTRSSSGTRRSSAAPSCAATQPATTSFRLPMCCRLRLACARRAASRGWGLDHPRHHTRRPPRPARQARRNRGNARGPAGSSAAPNWAVRAARGRVPRRAVARRDAHAPRGEAEASSRAHKPRAEGQVQGTGRAARRRGRRLLAERAVDLLLGLVADAAGVVDDNVRVARLGRARVARLLQHAGHALRVGQVHRAAHHIHVVLALAPAAAGRRAAAGALQHHACAPRARSLLPLVTAAPALPSCIAPAAAPRRTARRRPPQSRKHVSAPA